KAGSAGKNTVRERKLLSFKFAARCAFQHAEAGLSGARDGKRCRKFRGIYPRGRHAPDGQSTGRTLGEVRRAGRLRMLETLAAEAAGRSDRGVGAKRHRVD